MMAMDSFYHRNNNRAIKYYIFIVGATAVLLQNVKEKLYHIYNMK